MEKKYHLFTYISDVNIRFKTDALYHSDAKHPWKYTVILNTSFYVSVQISYQMTKCYAEEWQK